MLCRYPTTVTRSYLTLLLIINIHFSRTFSLIIVITQHSENEELSNKCREPEDNTHNRSVFFLPTLVWYAMLRHIFFFLGEKKANAESAVFPVLGSRYIFSDVPARKQISHKQSDFLMQRWEQARIQSIFFHQYTVLFSARYYLFFFFFFVFFFLAFFFYVRIYVFFIFILKKS